MIGDKENGDGNRRLVKESLEIRRDRKKRTKMRRRLEKERKEMGNRRLLKDSLEIRRDWRKREQRCGGDWRSRDRRWGRDRRREKGDGE